MSDPDFWNDPDSARDISQEATQLKDAVEGYKKLVTDIEEAKLMLEMAIDEEDTSMEGELTTMVEQLTHEVEHREVLLLLSGEYDKNNAILTFHAGAGGTEAQDWCSMLIRMYLRWAEKQGYSISLMDEQVGDEAGIKSATFLIKGGNAFGYMKSEKGVHRAGGQHINKTDSAVRMTHAPTGIVVQCQSERSQIQNREQCLKLLRAKLFELELEKQAELKEQLGGTYQAIEWGSQIRSYVFHTYNMVKDHRTSVETGNVQADMDGNLDQFMEGFLKKEANLSI